jgi:23S rRNA pseudouridine1911/1915/1917 synthase
MGVNAVDVNDVASRILYEDNHLIVVSKLCGEISQGDKTGDSTLGDLVKSYIKQRDAKPGNVFLTPVHRLDRPVSGATVLAKTTKATSRMNKLFRDGEVTKRYWAVTSSRPDSDEGDLVHFLTRNPKNNKSFARAEASDGAKRAELHFRIAGKSDR